jgi:hypothetical protein
MEPQEVQYFDDPYNDDVGQALKTFLDTKSKKENHFAMWYLHACLQWRRYTFNKGKRYRYGLGQVGRSYIIKVGPKKRGLLSKFRNRYVRVLCTHSRGWTVHQWFGTVKLTPDQERALVPAKNMCFYP